MAHTHSKPEANKTADIKEIIKRSSPVKGRKSKKLIKAQKKLPQGWYIRSVLLQGQVEIIFVTQSDLVNDAFFQNLVNELNEPSDETIEELDILGVYYMCVSLENTAALFNRNGYQRRCFVRVLEDEDLASENRLHALQVLKAFLEKPENNKYDTPVRIMEPGWDLTPHAPAPLKKLDSYLQYKEIKKALQAMFDNVDNSWATENRDAALAFFTPGHIPFQAAAELGFPLVDVMANEPGIVGQL